MASGPITSWQIEKQWKQWLTLFWGAPKSLQILVATMKLKDIYSWKESYDQPRQHIKKQRLCLQSLPTKVLLVKAVVFPVVMYGPYFTNKGPSSQGCGFSSGHVWM